MIMVVANVDDVQRNETVNHMRKYTNQAQKEYKTRHDWIGKVLLLELCKILKLDHTPKCSKRKPEPAKEKENSYNSSGP